MNERSVVPTLALSSLTMAVAFGFGRLFSDASFLWPVACTALAVHALAWLCRQYRLGTSVAVLAAIGTITAVAVWTVLPHTTAYGIPTGDTLRLASEELARARGSFSEVIAPAPPLDGFLLACALAIGITAFMADWAAFRLGAAYEACIPAFSLFLFTAALGTDRHRALSVIAFVGAMLAYLLAHQLDRPGGGTWFGGRSRLGPRAVVKMGLGLGAAALAAGLVIGPALPGAGEPAIVVYKNRNRPGPSDRATVSPLVDIRGRLVNLSLAEVFTVQSDARAYWRLTSLDTFDGAIWSSKDNYRPVGGALGVDGLQSNTPVTRVVQQFQIGALDSIWLPAAYRPRRVDGLGDVSFNADTGSLITPQDSSNLLSYTVESEVRTLSAESLATAHPSVPKAIADRYTDVPALRGRIFEEAFRIVARAPTPYAKAKALQDHFQRNFKYDLNARQGHDGRALETFLFGTRAGYCEQFAGAYAVLARIAGLPTRVAVGFTPGELQPDGRYHVRGEHAHAWPEVYLAGFGWVAFEPTPGRGAPGAQQYTGLPEAQDAAGAGVTPTTVATTPSTQPAGGGPTTTERNPFANEEVAAGASDREPQPLWRQPLVVVLAAVGLTGFGWVVTVPFLHYRRRARRRAMATSSSGAVLAAWLDAAEDLARAGLPRRSSETFDEYSRRAAGTAGVGQEVGTALLTLATDASAAGFSSAEPDDDAVHRSRTAADLVAVNVRERASLVERARWALDPRPLRQSRN